MRVSKSGLVIAIAYVVLATASVTYSYAPDPKESTVLMQLPLLPALVVIEILGLTSLLVDAPVLITCGLLIPAIAVALYAACWLFGMLRLRTRLVIGLGTLLVMSVLLFWPRTR